MSYLLVLAGIAGAAGAAFVSGAFGVELSPELQPVSTALMTMPNNTISANILFIVVVRFTKSAQRTSTIFTLAAQGAALMLRSKLVTQPLIHL